MSDVVVITSEQLREIVKEASQEAAINALSYFTDHVKVDPLKPLDLEDIERDFKVSKQTLLDRIHERNIYIVPFPKNKKRYAILAQDLFELLKRA